MNTPENVDAIDITMTFEDAMEEMESIVSRLERGDLPLDDAVSAYVRAEKLRRHCRLALDRAEMSVKKAVEGEDGERLEEFAPGIG
ncbi:MAG: exodeoxyribonuclease VII small subunit [Rickettsiales bacterium]